VNPNESGHDIIRSHDYQQRAQSRIRGWPGGVHKATLETRPAAGSRLIARARDARKVARRRRVARGPLRAPKRGPKLTGPRHGFRSQG